VYIDDKYVGDYEKMIELNENGMLDKLLKYNEGKSGASVVPTHRPASSTPRDTNPPPAISSGNKSKFCSECGGTLGGTSKFCPVCGAKV